MAKPKKLNLNHTFCFYLTCQYGSLKEAAYRMNISSSSASHWIAELETSLGFQLTKMIHDDMRDQKFTLTQAGSNYFMQILHPMKSMEEILQKNNLMRITA